MSAMEPMILLMASMMYVILWVGCWGIGRVQEGVVR